MGIILALIVFGFLVFFHELGHFLLAKKNGIAVTEFSLGMGPRLLSFVKGETRYSLKALPFGGSCQMLGEDGENTAENAFNNRPVWARISVVAAGPVFNFILAFVLALIVIGYAGYDRPMVTGVMEGYPAQEAGLMEGDVITAINDRKVTIYRDVQFYMAMNAGKPLKLTIERSGEKHSFEITPKQDQAGNYYMGIYSSAVRTPVKGLEIIKYSLYEVKYQMGVVIKSIGMMFNGTVSVNELSGPVGIVSMVDSVVEESTSELADAKTNVISVLLNMMNFSIMLSANLGVMNLLPIPALDGGRLVFLLLEAVRGKPIDREKEGVVHFAGLMLLMLLMVYVMFNDIRRIF